MHFTFFFGFCHQFKEVLIEIFKLVQKNMNNYVLCFILLSQKMAQISIMAIIVERWEYNSLNGVWFGFVKPVHLVCVCVHVRVVG